MDNRNFNGKEGKEIVPIMEEIINSGGQCKLRVTGYSMTTILKHLRDSVILTSPRIRKIKKGEIVFIQRKTGEYVLHRVLKIIDDETFIMNGDAQQWTEVVRFDQVIGVVESFYRDEKLISCDNKKYKIYMRLWVLLKPIRPLIFKSRNLIKKIIKKRCD